MEQIRRAQASRDFLAHRPSVSTLALARAYGKLEAGDLDEARLAIDALAALAAPARGPVDASRRDFEQALANLQLAYADAVTATDQPST